MDQTVIPESGVLCAYCQSSVLPSDAETHRCSECNAPYHQDCWEENNGCAIYGCAEVPETQHRQSVEIPVSYWGQEHKPCPECGEEILAAALRCRHCRTVFSTDAPLSVEEYRQLQARKERFPALRRGIIWRSVLCIIPFTAPLGALLLFFWYRVNRKDITAMPALYDGLCKVALGVAFGQTLLAVLALMIYSGLA